MGRIANLLLRIRDSLSDPGATRWSNDRLLRLIDEAQTDIVVKARLLRTYVEIGVLADTATYQLPSDAILVSRCIGSSGASTISTIGDMDRTPIAIKSHEQMDLIDLSWETTTGDGVEAIIFDKLEPGRIKVYPIPTTDDNLSGYFTTSDYGVLTDSVGDEVDAFGVTTDITTTATLLSSFTSDFGVVTDMQSLVTSLVIYYYRKPLPINNYALIDLDQYLEVDSIFDKAIKHYVVGMALRDDKDTQNRQIGNEELQLYMLELKEAKLHSSQNNMVAAKDHISYNPGI